MVRVGYARVRVAFGMYVSCCLCQFCSHWIPNANPFFLWNMGFKLFPELGSITGPTEANVPSSQTGSKFGVSLDLVHVS